jgi:hypothetical protein
VDVIADLDGWWVGQQANASFGWTVVAWPDATGDGVDDRIARDMHDELGSRLSTISLLVERVQRDAHNPDAVLCKKVPSWAGARPPTGPQARRCWPRAVARYASASRGATPIGDCASPHPESRPTSPSQPFNPT